MQVSQPKIYSNHAQNGNSGGSGDVGDIFQVYSVRIVINKLKSVEKRKRTR
jgi:hypothetical protein